MGDVCAMGVCMYHGMCVPWGVYTMGVYVHHDGVCTWGRCAPHGICTKGTTRIHATCSQTCPSA